MHRLAAYIITGYLQYKSILGLLDFLLAIGPAEG